MQHSELPGLPEHYASAPCNHCGLVDACKFTYMSCLLPGDPTPVRLPAEVYLQVEAIMALQAIGSSPEMDEEKDLWTQTLYESGSGTST